MTMLLTRPAPPLPVSPDVPVPTADTMRPDPGARGFTDCRGEWHSLETED